MGLVFAAGLVCFLGAAAAAAGFFVTLVDFLTSLAALKYRKVTKTKLAKQLLSPLTG